MGNSILTIEGNCSDMVKQRCLPKEGVFDEKTKSKITDYIRLTA